MIHREDEQKRVSSYTRSQESSGRIPETQNTRKIYCSAKRNKCCVQYVRIKKKMFSNVNSDNVTSRCVVKDWIDFNRIILLFLNKNVK